RIACVDRTRQHGRAARGFDRVGNRAHRAPAGQREREPHRPRRRAPATLRAGTRAHADRRREQHQARAREQTARSSHPPPPPIVRAALPAIREPTAAAATPEFPWGAGRRTCVEAPETGDPDAKSVSMSMTCRDAAPYFNQVTAHLDGEVPRRTGEREDEMELCILRF